MKHEKDLDPPRVFSKRRLASLAATICLTGAGYIWHQNPEQFKWNLDYFEVSQGVNYDSVCLETKPIAPSNVESLNKVLHDPEYKKEAIKKLSGALKIPTEIQDTNPSPSEDLDYYSEFFKFHKYLEEQYPLVHKHLKRELVNEVGLVYTWKGSKPELKPIMFTAHQDVVPVNKNTWKSWTYPPFSGHYDEETDLIWGRGAIDCKNLLLGELASIELLLSEGYTPERSVVLSFGFDEESSGLLGANYLSKFLQERYGDDGIYALVDEGGAISAISDNTYVATPVTAEKGYVDLHFSVHGHGGHSSVPPDHTTIGIASDLISLIEDNPYDYTFTEENPVYGFLTCKAKFDDTIPEPIKKAIIEAPSSKAKRNQLFQWLDQLKPLRELFRTSQAVDIISGGLKANALPEVTTFLVNHRIDVTSSVEATINKDLQHVKDIASKYDLGITVDGQVLSPATSNGYIEITSEKALEPAPNSPTKNSTVWDLFTGTIQDVFTNHIFAGQDIDFYVTTSMSSGNTDTKYYWPLTKNIYRFFPVVFDPEVMKIVHSVNEHVSADSHLQVIAFFYEYILNVNEYAANEA
ncbi:hypothetical protein KLU848_0601 [Kluyveromyces marxianus]